MAQQSFCERWDANQAALDSGIDELVRKLPDALACGLQRTFNEEKELDRVTLRVLTDARNTIAMTRAKYDDDCWKIHHAFCDRFLRQAIAEIPPLGTLPSQFLDDFEAQIDAALPHVLDFVIIVNQHRALQQKLRARRNTQPPLEQPEQFTIERTGLSVSRGRTSRAIRADLRRSKRLATQRRTRMSKEKPVGNGDHRLSRRQSNEAWERYIYPYLK